MYLPCRQIQASVSKIGLVLQKSHFGPKKAIYCCFDGNPGLWIVRALAKVIGLCSWARHFTLTVPLSTQEYNWPGTGEVSGKPDKCWGVTCDRL